MNLIVVLFALFLLGFQWPSSAKKVEDKISKSEKLSKPVTSPPEIKAAPADIVKQAVVPNNSPMQPNSEAFKPAVTPRVPILPSPIPQAKEPLDIGKVQQQLDDLVRLNQVLKANYRNQVDDIERITKQAKIHQQILNQIQLKKPLIPNLAPLTTDIEKQQALLAISQEANKSRTYLENLKPQSPQSPAKVNQKVS